MFTINKLNKISDCVNDILNDGFTLGENLENYDAVLVRSADMHSLTLPEETVAIARAGAGVNNIPVDNMSEQGIVVFNTPGANANAVKELAICGMLLAGRDIIGGIEWVKEQTAAGTEGLEALAEKVKSRFVGCELMGKKLGVIGLGAIGVLVANAACNGLGMEVLGYDPYMSVDAAWHLTRGVHHVTSLDDIYKECDFITMHLPLSANTKGMFGEDVFAKMKKGVVLLNFARGGLVDNDALLRAMDNGTVARYVTDFADEKVTGHPGVIAIPHLGASTPESEENCAEMAAKQLRDYLQYGNIRNSVNLPDCELPISGGFRLAFINRNVANMMGQVTAILAESDVNIEHMINSSRGNWAYTLMELSKPLSDESVARIANIDGIVRVRTFQ